VSHTHTATVTDPGHTHKLNAYNVGASSSGSSQGAVGLTAVGAELTSESNTTGITVSNSTEGSSGTNANLQPYIVVYMWKRTA